MSLLLHSSWLLLLLLVLLFTDAEQQQQQQQHQVKLDKPRSRPATRPAERRAHSVHISGELTTKVGHRCVWQTSGNVRVNLLLNCSTATHQGGTRDSRYWCRYAGKPDLCLAYGVKSSLYWKSLVETLKKRRHTCEGEKVLKVRACKKAPAEAHMKLTQRGRHEEHKDDKSKREMMIKRSLDEKKTERRTEEEEKKDEAVLEEVGVMNDMEVEESYCSDRWRSICSFLLKVFEGQ